MAGGAAVGCRQSAHEARVAPYARQVDHPQPPSREQIMALDRDGARVDRLEFFVGMMMRAPPATPLATPPLGPARLESHAPPSTVPLLLIHAPQSLASSCAVSR